MAGAGTGGARAASGSLPEPATQGTPGDHPEIIRT
jgi:hypothetical protein